MCVSCLICVKLISLINGLPGLISGTRTFERNYAMLAQIKSVFDNFFVIYY